MSDGYNATKREIEILEMRKENADLRSQLATAQATYLQFCKKHDEKLGKATAALKVFADPFNWRVDGSCDPNSSRFKGQSIAEAALKEIT